MNCPYCLKPMKEGYMESLQQLRWINKDNAGKPAFIPLAGHNFLLGSKASAYCCPDCKKVLLTIPDQP